MKESYTKLRDSLRMEHYTAHGAQKSSAKRLPSWWKAVREKKRTRTPVGDSGVIAIYRSCCERGNKFSLMHRKARVEYCV